MNFQLHLYCLQQRKYQVPANVNSFDLDSVPNSAVNSNLNQFGNNKECDANWPDHIYNLFCLLLHYWPSYASSITRIIQGFVVKEMAIQLKIGNFEISSEFKYG